ncbi:hypothetical protein GOBAR_AA00598 [Gossypium barbadense]|uniref:Uncharacterized protein n=1 Tax=Gossypium barbadense TaxID=3634 RepID=A0A2P5YWI6_GOSBA|nr:hypothetical protein GOBAR_AA00598 [Gossypium barbadense]
MSRFRKNVDACNDGNAPKGYCANQDYSEDSDYLVHDIAQHTNLRSGPHELLSRGVLGKRKLPVSPVKMLVGREGNFTGRGRFSSADGCHVLSRYLPVNGPRWVDRLQSRAYVSQFSADGSLFVAGFQKSQIRIYDVERGWKVQKNILAKSLKWTITDTSLSPDQHFLVYSSLSPVVHIVNVRSAASESIANITSDVNTVCFADETGHLLFSGSDDHLCKVWDRRCFGTRGKAAGVLIGHLEGITFIDSRGDGRYFISNGKDQTTKLWDIRMMSSNTPYTRRPRDTDFDYRWMDYPTHARALKHPHDQSLATYRGHNVLRTLIRCYFSPAYSTGQKYIYTGSSDGSLYIYDLVTGALVASCHGHEKPVRDCSWHPLYPMIITSSWDGVIARWEFPGSEEEPSETRGRERRPSF